MVPETCPESIQIQSLQNIIRSQDELLQANFGPSTNMYTTWRNECYRLSIRNRTLEDEYVKLVRRTRKEQCSNLQSLSCSILKEFDLLVESHRRRVHDHIRSVQHKLILTQRTVGLLERELPNKTKIQKNDRGKDLESRLVNIQSEVSRLGGGNAKLTSELVSRRSSNAPKPLILSTQKMPDPLYSSRLVKKDDEIHTLLAQLKSLEIEAKQMLIQR